MKRVKIFSAIILSVIIFDLLVNMIHSKNFEVNDPGSLYMSTLDDSSMEVIDYLNYTNKKQGLVDSTSRVSRSLGVSERLVNRFIVNQICSFDNDISRKCIESYIANEYSYQYQISEHKINSNTIIQDKIQFLQSITPAARKEVCDKLKMKKIKVYHIDNRKGGQILDLALTEEVPIFEGRRLLEYLAYDYKTLGYDIKVAQLHKGGSYHDICASIQKYNTDPDKLMCVGSNVFRLFTDEHPVASIITPDGLVCLTFINRPLKRTIKYKAISKPFVMENPEASLLVNELINQSQEIKEENLSHVGDVIWAGEMLEHNKIGGVIKHELKYNVLRQIFAAIPTKIFNNNNSIIIQSKRNTYLLVKEDINTEDSDTDEEIASANAIARTATYRYSLSPKIINIPTTLGRYTNDSIHIALKNAYGINEKLNEHDEVSTIDFYAQSIIFIRANKLDPKTFRTIHSALEVNELINRGYIFKS